MGMNAWWIAAKDILLFVRDWKALLMFILMPLLLIAILGSAFSGLFQSGEQGIEPIKVGIVNLDEGEMGRVIAKELFGIQLNEIFEPIYLNEEELRERIDQRKLSVGIIIKENFSKDIMSGSTGEVSLFSAPNGTHQAEIVESILAQFAQSVKVRQAAGKVLAMEVMSETDNGSQYYAEIGEKVEKLLAELDTNENYNRVWIEEQGIALDKKTVGSFQYYAAGMGVMYLLMAVVQGVASMIEEKGQEVYKRLLITKLKHVQYIVGKFLGLLIITMLQMAVIIVGTGVLFGVDWGDSVLGIAFIAFSFVIAACGLGVMIGSWVGREQTFSTAGMIMVQIVAALGGSMVPLYAFPEWLNEIVRFLPNALALQSFIELMAGAHASDIAFAGCFMLGIGLVFMAIAWLSMLGGRRGYHA
jgi:ABC-2 type transport system permease protein